MLAKRIAWVGGGVVALGLVGLTVRMRHVSQPSAQVLAKYGINICVVRAEPSVSGVVGHVERQKLFGWWTDPAQYLRNENALYYVPSHE